MATNKKDYTQPNKYGMIYEPRTENSYPKEIAPGLFDGTKTGRFKPIKEQKGWILRGKTGNIGGDINLNVLYEDKTSEQFTFSPYRHPDTEINLELIDCSLEIDIEGMLDKECSLFIRRMY